MLFLETKTAYRIGLASISGKRFTFLPNYWLSMLPLV
nr:MAG TPA: hypothetical protein [Caudoviricetes sp.]